MKGLIKFNGKEKIDATRISTCATTVCNNLYFISRDIA